MDSNRPLSSLAEALAALPPWSPADAAAAATAPVAPAAPAAPEAPAADPTAGVLAALAAVIPGVRDALERLGGLLGDLRILAGHLDGPEALAPADVVVRVWIAGLADDLELPHDCLAYPHVNALLVDAVRARAAAVAGLVAELTPSLDGVAAAAEGLAGVRAVDAVQASIRDQLHAAAGG